MEMGMGMGMGMEMGMGMGMGVGMGMDMGVSMGMGNKKYVDKVRRILFYAYETRSFCFSGRHRIFRRKFFPLRKLF